MKQSFSDLLPTNEKVLWEGRPDITSLFSREDRRLVTVGTLLLLLAMFLAYIALQQGNLRLFYFGTPLLLLPLYFMLGRLWLLVYQKRKTHYALTSKRILIESARDMQTFTYPSLPPLTVYKRSNDVGTIYFGEAPARRFRLLLWPQYDPASGLYDIHDVERVHRTILKLQAPRPKAKPAKKRKSRK